MRKKQKNGMLQKMLMAAVFLLVLTVIPPQTARAASGTVYTCSVTPSYSNPVTGEIEDAGGEAGYATGQGMVQSVVYSTGILEVTDSGEYYLTVRLGMMDSGFRMWVIPAGLLRQWDRREAEVTETERLRIFVFKFPAKTVW